MILRKCEYIFVIKYGKGVQKKLLKCEYKSIVIVTEKDVSVDEYIYGNNT